MFGDRFIFTEEEELEYMRRYKEFGPETAWLYMMGTLNRGERVPMTALDRQGHYYRVWMLKIDTDSGIHIFCTDNYDERDDLMRALLVDEGIEGVKAPLWVFSNLSMTYERHPFFTTPGFDLEQYHMSDRAPMCPEKWCEIHNIKQAPLKLSRKPSTYFLLSVISLMGLAPLGVVGLILSQQVGVRFRDGDYEAALRCSKAAAKVSTVGSLLAIVTVFTFCMLYF